MNWLVTIHILSAVIGIGPTFYSHYLTRSGQSIEEFKFSYRAGKFLYLFPMIGGPIAVISGIILTYMLELSFVGSLWISSSLGLYIAIQIIALGWLHPKINKIAQWVEHDAGPNQNTFPVEQQNQIKQINHLLNFTTVMSILIFIMMIIKPESL